MAHDFFGKHVSATEDGEWFYEGTDEFVEFLFVLVVSEVVDFVDCFVLGLGGLSESFEARSLVRADCAVYHDEAVVAAVYEVFGGFSPYVFLIVGDNGEIIFVHADVYVGMFFYETEEILMKFQVPEDDTVVVLGGVEVTIIGHSAAEGIEQVQRY